MSKGINEALALSPIYEDATYKYYGDANPGTALNVAQWRVSRVNKTTLQTEWANVVKGVASFNNLCTDLATVQGLSYS